MSIRLGVDQFADVRLGNDRLAAAYLGSEKIWPSTLTATITMPANLYVGTSSSKRWTGISTTIPVAFRDDPSNTDLHIRSLLFRIATLSLEMGLGGSGSNDDLSSAWETSGKIRFQASGLDLELDAPADREQSYRWPNLTITAQQFAAIAGGKLTITLTIPGS